MSSLKIIRVLHMSENYETEYLSAQVMFQVQEAVKTYYLKITPYKAKSHVLT